MTVLHKGIPIKRKPAFYVTHLVVLCTQALLALVLFINTPSEPQHAIFLGYSLEEILLLSVPLVIFLAGLLLWNYYGSLPTRLASLDARLDTIFRSRAANILNIVFLTVILLSIYLIASFMRDSFFVLAPYYANNIPEIVFERSQILLARSQPILFFVLGISVQAIFFVLQFRSDTRSWIERLRAQGFYTIVGVYGIFLVLWGLLTWGSRSFEPDFTGYSWHPLGVPILDTDVLFAFFIGLVLMGLATVGKAVRKRIAAAPSDNRDRKIDLAIGALIWLIAGMIWLSLPLDTNWFIKEPGYPNFEYYPWSDALKYDITAQNMLLGSDLLYYSKSLQFKPMYSTFLAMLHSLAGPGLENVSMLQSAIFGVFPVLVYLLTKRLHSRLAGILAALLVIFREANAIELTSEITVSHSRQLMPDTPAAIGVLLIIYIVYLWIQKPNKYIWLPVLIGAVVASLMQVRNELLLLLPLVLVFQALIFFPKPRYWIKTSIFMILSFAAISSLWQLRGMYHSGSSFLNASRVSAAVREGEVRSIHAEPEPELQTYERLQKIASHYIHTQKQAFLIFPSAFRPVDSLIGFLAHRNTDILKTDCCEIGNYMDRLHPFWTWQKWDGEVLQESLPAVFSTLFFIAVGIVRSKEKLGLIKLNETLMMIFPAKMAILAFRWPALTATRLSCLSR